MDRTCTLFTVSLRIKCQLIALPCRYISQLNVHDRLTDRITRLGSFILQSLLATRKNRTKYRSFQFVLESSIRMQSGLERTASRKVFRSPTYLAFDVLIGGNLITRRNYYKFDYTVGIFLIGHICELLFLALGYLRSFQSRVARF